MRILYREHPHSAQQGDTVLDALLRAGEKVAYGCRAGSCQSCLLRMVKGTPPAKAVEGLSADKVERGLFLACVCPAVDGLAMESADGALPKVPALIERVEWLSNDVLQVQLRPEQPFEYRAGQFLNLFRDDGLARSYSIASLPSAESIELHVRVLPHGAMSSWLASNAAVGATVHVRGPEGPCVYHPELPDDPLVLAGTGTGLAPLLGVVRDALKHQHRGPIHLLHGAWAAEGWYLRELLERLTHEHEVLTYQRCNSGLVASEAAVAASSSPAGPIGLSEPNLDVALAQLAKQRPKARFYLCGAPAFTQSARKKLFLSGASLQRIHADAFVVAPPPEA